MGLVVGGSNANEGLYRMDVPEDNEENLEMLDFEQMPGLHNRQRHTWLGRSQSRLVRSWWRWMQHSEKATGHKQRLLHSYTPLSRRGKPSFSPEPNLFAPLVPNSNSGAQKPRNLKTQKEDDFHYSPQSLLQIRKPDVASRGEHPLLRPNPDK